MIINMQLSVLLSAARLQLNLVWRPRDQNTEADDLTNEKFDDFNAADRISFTWRSSFDSFARAVGNKEGVR